MTRKDLAKIIKTKILPHFAELGYVQASSSLIKCPVNHILCGFWFDQSLTDPLAFCYQYAQPLYIKFDDIILSFGERLRNEKGIDAFNMTSETDIEFLINKMLQEHKTYIPKVETPLSFYKSSLEFSEMDRYQVCALTGCLIQDEKSVYFLDQYISLLQTSISEYFTDWKKSRLAEALELKQAYENNPDEAFKLLMEWEQYTISHLPKSLNISKILNK
jgi:hypothetical protein